MGCTPVQKHNKKSYLKKRFACMHTFAAISASMSLFLLAICNSLSFTLDSYTRDDNTITNNTQMHGTPRRFGRDGTGDRRELCTLPRMLHTLLLRPLTPDKARRKLFAGESTARGLLQRLGIFCGRWATQTHLHARFERLGRSVGRFVPSTPT